MSGAIGPFSEQDVAVIHAELDKRLPIRPEPRLWWHQYVAECDHHNAVITQTFAESTMPPEELRATESLLTCRASCGCQTEYVRSLDHDPDEDVGVTP